MAGTLSQGAGWIPTNGDSMTRLAIPAGRGCRGGWEHQRCECPQSPLVACASAMLAESRRAWMFCARQRNYLRILFDTDREASGLLAKTVASFASIGIPPRLIHVARRECWPGPCEVAGFNIWNYNKNPEDSHAKPNRTLDRS